MSQLFYTVRQVAEHLQCSTRTVRRAIKKGAVKAVQIMGMTRIPASELERLAK